MLMQFLRRLSLLVCLLFVFPVQADTAFSNVYVFGDSLSDTGNLASVIGDYPPPYVNNRLSNGPVAVEVLAEKLDFTLEASLYLVGQNAGTNFAVASARAGGIESIDLTTQVGAFLAVHGFSAPEEALYIVFIGGNDVRDARDLQDDQLADTLLKNAVDNIRQNVTQLIMSGARSIIVVNAPDIGSIPETLLIALQTSNFELIEQSTKKSRRFNRLLKSGLHEIEENHDIEIPVFNIFKLLRKVIANSESYGFEITSEPCFYRSTFTFHPDCNNGQNVNRFLFFDEEHPTAKGHAIVGNAILEEVKELAEQDDEFSED